MQFLVRLEFREPISVQILYPTSAISATLFVEDDGEPTLEIALA